VVKEEVEEALVVVVEDQREEETEVVIEVEEVEEEDVVDVVEQEVVVLATRKMKLKLGSLLLNWVVSLKKNALKNWKRFIFFHYQ
jgi:hypothetical protein